MEIDGPAAPTPIPLAPPSPPDYPKFMGMIGNLTRIPEQVREALHANPELIHGVIYPEDTPQTVPAKPSLLKRLLGRGAPEQSSQPLPPAPESDTLDVDKAWHALHFLFTGSGTEGGFPEGFLMTCGSPVGDEDVGYGPARSFTPEQVKGIAAYLSSLSHDDLRERFDCKKLTDEDIYPAIWENCETEGELKYLLDSFDDLQGFIREAADREMALLTYIN